MSAKSWLAGSLAALLLMGSVPSVIAAEQQLGPKCEKKCVKECAAIAPGSGDYCNMMCREECDPNAPTTVEEAAAAVAAEQ